MGAGQLPSWSWVEINCQDCRSRDARAIGLRWSLPDSSLENWVLGFAPYALAPVTRRVVEAPFSVLALRTLDHPSNSFFPVREDLAVHLANMPLHLPCPVHAYTRKFDERTQRTSQQLLNGEMEDAARARVTLPLSESAFQELYESGRQGPIRKFEKWSKEKLKTGLRRCLDRL